MFFMKFCNKKRSLVLISLAVLSIFAFAQSAVADNANVAVSSVNGQNNNKEKINLPGVNISSSNVASVPANTTTDISLPGDNAKNSSALLPLEQPMVAFPQNNNKSAAPLHAAVKIIAPVKAISGVDETDKQILAVNPASYTIQLTSDHQLKYLQQFAIAHDLQNKTTYFRTHDKQGQDLYVLIYGQYDTSVDAETALAKLPASARSEGAFMVKYSTIQAMLKKTG